MPHSPSKTESRIIKSASHIRRRYFETARTHRKINKMARRKLLIFQSAKDNLNVFVLEGMIQVGERLPLSYLLFKTNRLNILPSKHLVVAIMHV